MIFYPGLHQPCDAKHFARCMISLSRLVERGSDGRISRRKKDNRPKVRRRAIECNEIMIDPQAYTILQKFGCYPDSSADYAELLQLLSANRIVSATAQDYVCDNASLARTGLTVEQHLALTIARYDELLAIVPAQQYIMPVLHGRSPRDYVRHLEAYADRLEWGAWVGVGSIARLSRDTDTVVAIISAIKAERPDLKLHGFGLSLWALRSGRIRGLLQSADSVAWSLTARREGRDQNDHCEAIAFCKRLAELDSEPELLAAA